MKRIKYTSYATASVWMVVAFITVGSIYLSVIGWIINLAMGVDSRRKDV